MPFTAFRSGRYTGLGDALWDLVAGRHGGLTPLQYHRAVKPGAMMHDWLASACARGCVQRDSGDSPWSTGEWTITNDGAGTTTNSSVAPLVLTSANVSGNKNIAQFGQGWTPTSRGNRAWGYTRVSLSAATTTQHFWFGFSTTTTDPVGSTPTNFIGFKKASGAATLVGSSQTIGDTATLLTLANDTAVDIGFILTPTSTTSIGVQWYTKATLATNWILAATQTATITAGNMRLMFFNQTAAASARTATIQRYAFGFED